MAYLHWKNGRLQCPPCPVCGAETDERQEVLWDDDPDGRLRRISLFCGAGHTTTLGTYRHLGGHSFEKVGD
jgi:hypothetical protein